MNNKCVSPIRLKGGSRERIVEDIHVFSNSIRRHGDIVDGEPILGISLMNEFYRNYLRDFASVRSILIIVRVDVKVTPRSVPTLPVGWTVDAAVTRGISRTMTVVVAGSGEGSGDRNGQNR